MPSSLDGKLTALTAATRVRDALLTELLEQRIAPGQRLDEAELAHRFGVSRTPVREALKALAAQDLIELRPHAGAFAAEPNPRQLIEMFETMAELEAACASYAARRASGRQRDAMEEANRSCAHFADLGDATAFYAANHQFHEALRGAAGNGFLAEQTSALTRRLEPWRRSITWRTGLMRQSVTEHEGIVAAISAGDSDAAGRRARAHLDTLREDALLLLTGLQSRL